MSDRANDFDALVDLVGEKDFSLSKAAALIARCYRPDTDVEGVDRSLDELASSIDDALAEPAEDATDKIRLLNEVLFEREGFKGNSVAYGDVSNSFIDEVIRTRTGIPITLSILYIEVARRIGLDARGLGFPGHFLVGVRLGAGRLVVLDPFFSGASLEQADLMSRLKQFVPDDKTAKQYLEQVLHGSPKREIIARVLRNVREVFLSSEQFTEALSAADLLVRIDPEHEIYLRDRGDIYFRLEAMHAARRDYEAYLEKDPEAPDAQRIKQMLVFASSNDTPLS